MAALAVVPLRGRRFNPAHTVRDPFARPWTILGADDTDRFLKRYEGPHGVPGNFAVLRDRLRPDAYLFVRAEEERPPNHLDVYDYAETLLGSLCLVSLLAPEDPDGSRQYIPKPLYWIRIRESCDLPLVIGPNSTRIVGHSSAFTWLGPDEHSMDGSFSLDLIDDLIVSSPVVIQETLEGTPHVVEWKASLQATSRALHSGFQATSSGQLLANMATVAELLVNKEPREGWRTRIARLKVLTGPIYWTRVEAIMAARHEFIHAARQPTFPYLAFGALGLAVHSWIVMHELCETHGGRTAALEYLDALVAAKPPKDHRTADLSPLALSDLKTLYERVPRGPLRTRHWLNQSLTDVAPNDYYTQFSIFGSTSCPECGHMLKSQHSVERTADHETFVCDRCKSRVKTTQPFSAER
jgi:hypothetical protein